MWNEKLRLVEKIKQARKLLFFFNSVRASPYDKSLFYCPICLLQKESPVALVIPSYRTIQVHFLEASNSR